MPATRAEQEQEIFRDTATLAENIIRSLDPVLDKIQQFGEDMDKDQQTGTLPKDISVGNTAYIRGIIIGVDSLANQLRRITSFLLGTGQDPFATLQAMMFGDATVADAIAEPVAEGETTDA